MQQRFVSIWFRHLHTDWFTLRQPQLRHVPFVLRTPVHGRMIISAVNRVAEKNGITPGLVLADARAICPDLEVQDDRPDLTDKLLHKLAGWCIRFSPYVCVDAPDGLLLDATGCPHLWGSDEDYVADITNRLTVRGYHVRVAITDTIGLAWGVARFGKSERVVCTEQHVNTLMHLPPEALRLDKEVVDRLHKLGLHKVRQFMHMPRPSLRRRFGEALLTQLDMALGQVAEMREPVVPVEPYQERLPAIEPIVTAVGIEIALNELLENLCDRLQHNQKGLRTAVFKCYRVDGKVIDIQISTSKPSHHVRHLFKLFEIKLPGIEPDLGIELFVLQAPRVEDHLPGQEKIWEGTTGLADTRLAELIDRLAVKVGPESLRRYLPDEHYWPERAYKKASSLQETPAASWSEDRQRPLHLLPMPVRVEVTAPIPDYPPMLFRLHGKVHNIVKADGPERIEQEWWLQQGQHRDYYRVEDEAGHRYWLFRLGHYHDKTFQWFLHGYFA